MAWYLKWPADSGSLPANNRLVQISGIATTGAFNVAITYAENFPAQARGHYLYDGRRSLDSNTDDGTNSYIFNGGQVNTSNWRVNGVTTGSSGSLINTSRVAGDVISFDAAAQANGVIAIGARFNATESFSNVAISRIVITDSAGTHTIDMSDSNGTATQFTSTDGVLTLKLFNFNPATCWIFYSSGATYQLTALGGTFSYSGAQASLLRRFRLQTLGATYAYSGASANLTYVPTGTIYTLTALGGSFAYSGGSANVRMKRRLVAQGGNYNYSGGQASLLRRFRLVANGGAYAYAGGSANLTYNQLPGIYRLTALGATYTYAGGIAALTATGVTPMANPGAYVIQAYVGGTQTISAKIGGRQTINAMVAT